MNHTYTHLIRAFLEICGNDHGATFVNGDIETLQINGVAADSAIIAQIKVRADQLASNV